MCVDDLAGDFPDFRCPSSLIGGDSYIGEMEIIEGGSEFDTVTTFTARRNNPMCVDLPELPVGILTISISQEQWEEAIRRMPERDVTFSDVVYTLKTLGVEDCEMKVTSILTDLMEGEETDGQ